MTTKIDLLRDILTDALINLDFNIGYDDDGEFIDEQHIIRDEIVSDMLSAVEDFDQLATKSDFTVKVVMDKLETK